jgi:outer membrane protein assembly factor BamD (BamD/ComL family)
MDREHRRSLKHDKFVDEIGALSSRARENQRLLLMIGLGVVALALIVWGVYFFRSSRESKAQMLLATAIETSNATIESAQNPNKAITGPSYKTEAERNAVAEKQFKDVQSQYSGSDAADMAGLWLAKNAAAKGDTATARKMLQEFIDDHGKTILGQSARYSLYQVRIDSGEAAQVATELNAELSKADPILPGDSILILLAHAYEVQGNSEKSRAAYKRISTEFPDSPYAVEAARRAG